MTRTVRPGETTIFIGEHLEMQDLSYGTGIELRLPMVWNGRLLFQSGGGLDGMLMPAYGSVPGFPSALTRGFVVVSTDGGHRGRNNVDARFAADQQAKLDFAYQSVQRTTREAKMIVYHGLSDQAMWTGAQTQWYEQLTPRDS